MKNADSYKTLSKQFNENNYSPFQNSYNIIKNFIILDSHF